MERNISEASVHDYVSALQFLVEKWEHRHESHILVRGGLLWRLEQTDLKVRDVVEDWHCALLLKLFEILGHHLIFMTVCTRGVNEIIAYGLAELAIIFDEEFLEVDFFV